MISKEEMESEELLINREIEWLRFDERVLSEAANPNNPLMERLKFLIIFHTNLDEFFMVRLARLLRLLDLEPERKTTTDDDNDDAEEMFDEVAKIVRQLLATATDIFHTSLIPELATVGIVRLQPDDLTASEQHRLSEYFFNQIFPILTPLAVDPAHPFPYLANLSVYLALHFQETQSNGQPLLGFVEIPKSLNRIVRVKSDKNTHAYILLEDLIRRHLSHLFPWTSLTEAYTFRVTRNLDYQLLEGEVQDLMKALEIELKDRAQKNVVRLEVEPGLPQDLRQRLQNALELDNSETYTTDLPLNMKDLLPLLKADVDPMLRDAPFLPRTYPALLSSSDIFASIREKPMLLHHPFDSFAAVLEFLRQAAEDPNVLAIKQTLYRIGVNSPIIDILIRAAENGKQVTVVVELKARFDEHNNIEWARRLERSGVHVVFGFVGLKTHAKCALVIRREHEVLRRYLHLSTGNYNHLTAKIYTDLSMLTDDPATTRDIMDLFNILTGFNLLGGDVTPELSGVTGDEPAFNRILVAPFSMRQQLTALIEAEGNLGSEGRIILKMNSLIDPSLIAALYQASEKGVSIDLIIRGMCALRPGLPKYSENIRVTSIVDRFLEHTRIFWFGTLPAGKLFLGSADFMARNMDRRIETLWPVDDFTLRAEVYSILQAYLRDNQNSHIKLPDGTYVRSTREQTTHPFRAQDYLIALAHNSGSGRPRALIEQGMTPYANDNERPLHDEDS